MSKTTATVNRNHKDKLFRKLFSSKKELLSLYNALHNTDYSSTDELEIILLDNALFIKPRNDIACIIDLRLSMIEHQASVNPNMPLRSLKYVVEVINQITVDQDLYSRKLIMLPTPSFIVLYNGVDDQLERRIMRLSDSYMVDPYESEPSLELIVTQLNINDGFNENLKNSCPTLFGYCRLVSLIRSNQKNINDITKSVDSAINTCIEEGILVDFLKKNRKEVSNMGLFDYNEELHERTLREEGREEGLKEGREKEREEIIHELLNDGSITPDRARSLRSSRTSVTV